MQPSGEKFKVILFCHLVARVGNARMSILQAQLLEVVQLGLGTVGRRQGDIPPEKSSVLVSRVSEVGSPGTTRKGIQSLNDKRESALVEQKGRMDIIW